MYQEITGGNQDEIIGGDITNDDIRLELEMTSLMVLQVMTLFMGAMAMILSLVLMVMIPSWVEKEMM